MQKRGSFTVRGAKAPTNRTSAETVFAYGTVPRNFRGSVHNNRSPGSPFSNGRGGGSGPYSTYGRRDGQNMSSFGGAVVVDGLVMNRFQKPAQEIYAKGSNVMNSDFYSGPPSQASEVSPPPPLRFQGDYSRDDSFEDADSPNSSYSQEPEMSYNNNYPQHPPAIPENPPVTRRPPPDNKASLLLSREENQVVFDILGKGRHTLATAVVQLIVPIPDQSRWQVKETGVVCLVRDTTKKSYFIQVFSLATRSMVFRQEIYNQFEYEVPNQCFLTFEGDNSTVGINFADPTEASNFREGLDSKLEAKRQRRNEREHRRSRYIADNHSPVYAQQNQPQYQPQQQQRNKPAPMTNGASTVSTTYTFPASTPNKNKGKSKGKDKNKKVSLRKEDIGKPMDFRHVQHVGWNPNTGFDLNGDVDDGLRVFFEKAGVSSDALKDEKTRKFIYNFIEQHGGVESIRNARPVAPPPPPSNPNVAPPPIPNRTVQQKPAAPPPPPSRPVPPVPGYNPTVPPPPPPMRTSSSNVAEKPSANQFQSQSYNQSNGPARPPPPSFTNSPKQNQSQTNGAPPPPPPPMPGFGAPPPPPPPPMAMPGQPASDSPRVATTKPSMPPVPDDRCNLLAAIQKGVQLKHVDPTDTPPKKTGGLADCLGQIQKGVDLKRVQQTPKEPSTIDTMDGLAGALARALADRQRVINPDSSSDDDEEEEAEDDEWD